MNAEQITIRAFRAVDDKVRCARYLMEHIRVLDDIGVTTVIKPDISWCLDPDVVVVVAEHAQLGMVAGIRLHKAHPGQALPIEACVSRFDGSIGERISSLVPAGVGEVAGLWNAHRFAGRGVPLLLMEAVVSIANQAGVHSLITFIAEYVAPYAKRNGFRMMHDLKEGGDYVYPVPSIRTHAMILTDSRTLEEATYMDRHTIMSLRLRPNQFNRRKPKQSWIEVTYDLIVDKALSDHYARMDRFRESRAA